MEALSSVARSMQANAGSLLTAENTYEGKECSALVTISDDEEEEEQQAVRNKGAARERALDEAQKKVEGALMNMQEQDDEMADVETRDRRRDSLSHAS